MKTLRRNQRDFEYIPFNDRGTDVNADGDHTGNYDEPSYGTPIPYAGNISEPTGKTAYKFYGLDIRYSHILVMDKPDNEFNELGVIRWNGKLYEIKAVRPSINSFSAALREMSPDELVIPEPEGVTGGDEDEPDIEEH